MINETPRRRKVTIRCRTLFGDDPARILATLKGCFDAGADEVELEERADSPGQPGKSEPGPTAVPDEPRETELAAAGNAAIEGNRADRQEKQRAEGADPDARRQAPASERLNRRGLLKKAAVAMGAIFVGAAVKKCGEEVGEAIGGEIIGGEAKKP